MSVLKVHGIELFFEIKGDGEPLLLVYGDRDPLYPVEMGVEMYRAIPHAALWVVPGGGHGPIFREATPAFVQAVMEHFGAKS